MTKPTNNGIIISSKLTQLAHASLNAVESGDYTGLHIINLSMTIKLRDQFHTHACAMPAVPECTRTIIRDCTLALNAGTPAIVYADELRKTRQWIEGFRRQLSRLRIEKITAVLEHISMTNMIKGATEGIPIDGVFIEEQLAQYGFGHQITAEPKAA